MFCGVLFALRVGLRLFVVQIKCLLLVNCHDLFGANSVGVAYSFKVELLFLGVSWLFIVLLICV